MIDTKPRTLSTEQQEALKMLSLQVMKLMELRKKNIELERTKFLMEQRNNELEQFAMVLAHDIKSPLTALMLSNEYLEEAYGNVLGDEGIKFLRNSRNGAGSIKKLVDGILKNYSGDETRNRFSLIDLPEFVAELELNVASKQPCEITTNITDQQMSMNRVELLQVFLNLVSNSIRYGDKAIVKIHIEYSNDETYYQFIFSDNGPGIAPVIKEKIFELFSTLRPSDRYGIKGNGIGLPTIKKIIETYGGDITIDSQPGVGSKFTFRFKKSYLGV